jgi:hypothetical protein
VNTAGEDIDWFHTPRNYSIVARLVVVYDVNVVRPCEGGQFVDRLASTINDLVLVNGGRGT